MIGEMRKRKGSSCSFTFFQKKEGGREKKEKKEEKREK